ncbi:MAG: hypothetical protein JNL67_08165 [Planctomycetaceae bacterium]|nr:hypothetical protein [Planctomycetaceae bacterium]
MSAISPSELSPSQTTRHKLNRVARRRLQFLLFRTAAAFVLVFLGLLLTGAMVDKFGQLSDEGRMGWSVLTYFAGLAVTCVSMYPLLRPWTLRDAARFVEQEVPDLRNKLLSAVELTPEIDDPRLGSRELRSQLNVIVAESLQGISVADVLPWKRIRKMLIAASGVTVLMGVLAMVPGLNLPQYMLRLLYPIGNFPRPSLAELNILSPNPASKTLAIGEPLLFRVVAELPNTFSGRLPEAAELEMKSDQSATLSSKVTLKREPATKDSSSAKASAIYSAVIPIELSQFNYRAVSSLGETPWYALKAFPRPLIKEFDIAVAPPKYALMDRLLTQSAVADVEVIAGSHVTWTLDTNVALRSASIRWLDQTTEPDSEPVQFAINGAGQWQLQITANESRRFQIDLLSSDDLPSTFPPTYRLAVLPDLPPRLEWVQPKERYRVTRPRSSSDLAIAWVDEFPLQTIEQWTRVNRGNWRRDALSPEHLVDSPLHWTWEMAALNTKVGDMIETKVVAVDRKGQIGETPTIEWTVAGTELDASQDPETLIRIEISRRLAGLGPVVKDKEAKLKVQTERWWAEVQNVELTKELTDEVGGSVRELEVVLHDLRGELQPLLGQLRNPASQEETQLLIDTISSWELEAKIIGLTLEPELQRELIQSGSRHPAAERLRSRYQNLLHFLQRLPINAQTMASHDLLADFARDLDDANRFLEETLRDPEALQRRQGKLELAVLGDHLMRVGQSMGNGSSLLADWQGNALRELGQAVNQLGERTNSLADSDQIELHQIHEIGNLLLHRSNVSQVFSWLPEELKNTHRELYNYSGRTKDFIIRAMHDWQRERAYSVDGSLPSASFLAMLELLQHRRSTRYSRLDHSPKYAADLGAAQRALKYQVEKNSGNPQKIDQRIQQIADAVAVIESGQRVENASQFLETVLHSERYAATGKIARTENPRLWDAFSSELEKLHETMSNSHEARDLANRVNEMRWTAAMQSAWTKLSSRRWNWNDKPVSAASELATIRTEVLGLEAELQPRVDTARQLLAELGPPISELATRSAEAVATAQAATADLQKQVQDQEAPNVAARLNDHLTQEEKDREQTLQPLREALLDLAAAQDLTRQTEQQVARTADLARELMEAVQAKTEQAAAAAQQAAANNDSNNTDQQTALSQSLEQLSAAQARETEALAAISEHFAQAERNAASPHESSSAQDQSQQRLQQLAQQQLTPETTSALEQAFSKANDLASLQQRDPSDLLRGLEQELPTNAAMQEELSDIARNLAEQSQRSVEDAASRERALQASLEQSDRVREPQRQEFAQELQQALDQARDMASRLSNEAQQQMQRGESETGQQAVQQASESLQNAIHGAQKVAESGRNPALQQAAQTLRDALQQAQPALQSIAQNLAQEKATNPFDDDNQRQNARNDANQLQQQLADRDRQQADHRVQHREQQANAAQEQVNQAQQSLTQAEQDLNNAREQQKNQPDNEWLRQQVPLAQARVAQQQAVKSGADALRDRAQNRLEAARQERQRLENRPADLSADNPHLELAERMSQQAADQANRLERELGDLLNRAGFMSETQASRESVAQAAQQQGNVQEQVNAAARDLDRAAAHQSRLGAPQSAQALQQAAEDLASVVQREPENARKQLDQVRNQSAQSENKLQADADETKRINQALDAAGEALQEQAEALAQMLGQQATDANQSSTESGADSPVSDSHSPASNNSEGQAADRSQAEPTHGQNGNSPTNSMNQAGETNQAKSNNQSNPSSSGNSSTSSNSSVSGSSASSANVANANPNNAGATNPSDNSHPKEGNSTLAQMTPREKAELLDQLDRQSRGPSSGDAPDSLAPTNSSAMQGQASTQTLGSSRLPAFQQAQRSLAQQLQAMRQSSTPGALPSELANRANQPGFSQSPGRAAANPMGSGPARAFATDEMDNEPIGSWSRLREKKSEDVVESEREGVSPRYRRQIEHYYKLLSEKSRVQD